MTRLVYQSCVSNAIATQESLRTACISKNVQVSVSTPLHAWTDANAFFFRTTLDDVLECVICLDDVENAHLCPLCSKVACLQCWEQIIPRICPNCRGDLRDVNLIRCYWIADLGNCVKELKLKSEQETTRKAELENELVNIRTQLSNVPGPSAPKRNSKTPKPKNNQGSNSGSLIPPLMVCVSRASREGLFEFGSRAVVAKFYLLPRSTEKIKDWVPGWEAWNLTLTVKSFQLRKRFRGYTARRHALIQKKCMGGGMLVAVIQICRRKLTGSAMTRYWKTFL